MEVEGNRLKVEVEDSSQGPGYRLEEAEARGRCEGWRLEVEVEVSGQGRGERLEVEAKGRS